MKICSVADCGRPFHCRDLCRIHYKRFWKTGKVGPAQSMRHANYGRGWKLSHGYKVIYMPSHPSARVAGWIAEHTLIMTALVGRPLLPGETVHHKNGIKTDNRAENLELWTRRHGNGERGTDLVAWAKELLAIYEPKALA